jgi:hypothetical protein
MRAAEPLCVAKLIGQLWRRLTLRFTTVLANLGLAFEQLGAVKILMNITFGD